MAKLVHAESGLSIPLLCANRIGRHPGNDIPSDDPRVSEFHALLAWSEHGWRVRDLGSKNGTWVNGHRIQNGDRVPIGEGDSLGFGGSTWRLHLGPGAGPEPAAVEEGTGDRVFGSEGTLELTDGAQSAHVFRTAGGAWCLELEIGAFAVKELDVVSVGSRRYVLHLPARRPDTMSDNRIDVLRATAVITVTPDEDGAALVLEQGAERLDLGHRACFVLLHRLAQERLKDEANGEPPDRCGWVHQDVLCAENRWTPNYIFVQVHRARKATEGKDVLNMSALVERMFNSPYLRIGAGSVRIGGGC